MKQTITIARMAALLAAVVLAATLPAAARSTEKNPSKQKTDLTQPHRYVNPTGDAFPVMAWYSLLGDQVTPDRYREMAAAGINLSFSHFSTADEVAAAFDACRGTGVKLLIMCGEMASDPEATVRRFRHEKDNAGYFLRDEPICDAFGELAAWARRIRSEDDSRMLYLNLLPNYVSPRDLHADSYADYVRRFIDEVGLGLVSFDHYPVTFDGLRPEFYANLEDIAAESRRAGVPFWAFALATAHDEIRDLLVLLRYTFVNIDHEKNNICILYGFYGTVDRVVLHIFLDLRFPSDSSCIENGVIGALVDEGSSHDIPSRAGYRADNRDITACEKIHKSRFACIRLTEYRKLDALRLLRLILLSLEIEHSKKRILKLLYPEAMSCGDSDNTLVTI